MTDKMDLSLDDIIKINKQTNKGGRGRGGRRGRGGVAQARNRQGSVVFCNINVLYLHTLVFIL